MTIRTSCMPLMQASGSVLDPPESADEKSPIPTTEAPEALQGQMSPQSDLWSAGSTQLPENPALIPLKT